jgi:hypothetical protein
MTMWSSIPARMEYACGHAALLSLPRIKGETSRQRSERVSREKLAAQARICDFCTPAELPLLASVASVDLPLPVAPPEIELPLASATPPLDLTPPLAPPDVRLEALPLPAAGAEAVALAPRPRVTRRRTARVQLRPVAAARQFRVRYLAQQVIVAVDIHDAIRQAEALGAADITSLTRLD